MPMRFDRPQSQTPAVAWEAYTVQPYIDGRWENFDPFMYGPEPILNNDDVTLRVRRSGILVAEVIFS